ncbi:MAG: DUF6049 family protein [Pseudonocardia sp.]|nr:DUF6049 family protein [Pseudonocardia sp.]
MRAVAASVVLLLLLLTGMAGTAAAADRAPRQASAAGPLQLALDTFTPGLVTGDGPAELTLSGTLTNTSATAVDAIGLRIQRGDALTAEGQVRDALEGSAAVDSVTPTFTDLPDALAPGGSVPFRLSIPFTGPPASSLALTRPGVYPLLLNVNGAQDGVRARLAAARTLLPVQSLPGADRVPVDGPAVPFTMLYPIADVPHRLPEVPGEQTTLTDDDLAASFAPGGRLAGVVSALASRAPTGTPLRAGMCVAVDPGLVETAAAMRNGYLVRTPSGTRPGTGAADAGRWVDQLSTVLRGSCVLALPQDDADLVALVRGGAPDLASRAVTDGRSIAAAVLGTPVLADTLWPADGLIDDATLGQVGGAQDGTSALLLSADGVDQGRTTRTSGVVALRPPAGAPTTTAITAVLTDPLLTEAAAGTADLGTGAGSTGAPSTSLAGAPGPLSTQDVVGALTFRARVASAATPGSSLRQGPLVLAPPHRWPVDGAGADAVLTAAARLVQDGLLAPRALGASVSAGPPSGSEPLTPAYPVRASAAEVPTSVVEGLVADRDVVDRLRAAATYEPGVGANPALVFDSLLRGLLRGASSAWRGDAVAASANAAAVGSRIAELAGSVRVLEPPGPYSLGTRDAPILLTVANGLPVTMTVQVELASVGGGLRVSTVPVQRVPPLGRVQVRVDAEVTRSGTFAVEAAVRTPDGGALGTPTRLQVRSTVYGIVTVWLTVVAGVALVVLAGFRIVRRIRSGDGAGPAADARAVSHDTPDDTPDDTPPTEITDASDGTPVPAPPERSPAPSTPAGWAPEPGRVPPGPARSAPARPNSLRPGPVRSGMPPGAGFAGTAPPGAGGDPTGPTVPLRRPPGHQDGT